MVVVKKVQLVRVEVEAPGVMAKAPEMGKRVERRAVERTQLPLLTLQGRNLRKTNPRRIIDHLIKTINMQTVVATRKPTRIQIK